MVLIADYDPLVGTIIPRSCGLILFAIKYFEKSWFWVLTFYGETL